MDRFQRRAGSLTRSVPCAAAILAVAILAAPLLAPGCGPAPLAPADLAGTWRAVLESPGGELPFGLTIEAAPGGSLAAAAVNGPEAAPFTSITFEEGRVTLRFDHYDSVITAELSPGGREMRGGWERQAGRERPSMPFRAERVERPPADLADLRFGRRPASAAGPAAIADVTGAWNVVFTDEEGEEPARAEFRQEGTRLTGTFLTPTGDYRYLAGDYAEGLLRLSCFDGGHAFLFHARAQEDGTLSGDFWSRSAYHAAWTARRAAEAPQGPDPSNLPDPFEMTDVTNPSGRLSFTFPDLDGNPVSLADGRFAGKAVIVDLFGSWCPNCNDQAPFLADLHRRYRGRGLEVVGLAYEMTGDPSRDGEFVRRFAERHGIEYPLLLAGTSDKAEASATLPDLSGVLAFPTTIFIGRDGKVASIHTGWAGPGTGAHHERLRARFVEVIESLL